MNFFELLSNDILREIFSKTDTLSDITSIRRTCKQFYQATKLYDRDLFEVRYNDELSRFGIRSENMICYMSQGFYYNFFPAVRHAIRNGVLLSRKNIKIDHDASGRLYNQKYIDNRLSLWKTILNYYKMTEEQINFVIYYAWKNLTGKNLDLPITNFYLSLMRILVCDHKIKVSKSKLAYRIVEKGNISINRKTCIDKFNWLLMLFIE